MGPMFCRCRCGRSRAAGAPLMQNPWFILAMLFLMVGPLALPLLWRSARFGLGQKLAITAANLAYAAGIFWALMALYQSYLDLLAKLSGG